MAQGPITFREKYNVSKYQHLKRPKRNFPGPPRQPQIIPEAAGRPEGPPYHYPRDQDAQRTLREHPVGDLPRLAVSALDNIYCMQDSAFPENKNVVRKLGSLGERLGEPLEHLGRPCVLLSIPRVPP